MADRVSLKAAADYLAARGDRVSVSTLSRYLAQHAEAIEVERVGRELRVDAEALAAHRAENVRLGPARPAAGIPATAARPDGKRQLSGTQADGAARKAIADAELREMDLAERRRTLTPVAEVDAAGRDAVVLMTSAFERAIETEAASLALKYGWDERQARVALKGFMRKGLEVFHGEMLNRLDALRRAREVAGEAAEAATLQ